MNDAIDKKSSLSAQEQAINQLFIRVLKVERLLEKVEKKAGDASAGPRRDSSLGLNASGDSRNGTTAKNLAAMLIPNSSTGKRSSFASKF